MTVEFRILGPLEVDRDGSPVELGPPRERALLALLLTRANETVSRDSLIDELWLDDPPRSAVNVLQTYVSHLRKALPPERLATRSPGYVLRVEPGELDLHRFEELVEEGRRRLAAGDETLEVGDERVVAPGRELGVEPLLEQAVSLAAPLARAERHELVVVRAVPDAAELAAAAGQANAVRARLAAEDPSVRAAAFTSPDPVADVVRLVAEVDAALLVLAVPGALGPEGRLEERVAGVLARAPCDVAVLLAGDPTGEPAPDAPVVLPFGGAEHEWAAAEVAAWLAQAEGRPLRLVGRADDAGSGRPDASRLLASVALLLQQVADVPTEPSLVELDPGSFGPASDGARAVVAGVPDDWRARGAGRTRALLLHAARAPVLLVRGGVRPGGLAPPHSLTRFTWTVGGRA